MLQLLKKLENDRCNSVTAFTLIELLVVIAIIATIAALFFDEHTEGMRGTDWLK